MSTKIAIIFELILGQFSVLPCIDIAGLFRLKLVLNGYILDIKIFHSF